jgi:hypothetical protein
MASKKEEYERRFRELSAKLDGPEGREARNRAEAELIKRIDQRIRAETRARNLAYRNRKPRIIGSNAVIS